MEQISIADREVLEVIREKYDEIFPAEKKIADFVMCDPVSTVSYNVAGLAAASGVSDATVIRMCHHLGYSGYHQFRLALSRDIGRAQKKENTGLPSNDVIGQIFNEYAALVNAAGRNLNIETLRECISLIKNAGTVHLISMGNTTNLARYAGFRLERLGIRSTYSELPEYYINHINLASPEDIVVAITKSGASKRVLDGMILAKEKGLKMIAVTAFGDSEAAHLADYVLVSSSLGASENYYKGYSYLGEFVLLETLLKFVTNEELIDQRKAVRPEMILAGNKL